MADIKCPMCGKSNPEGSETCQYCQARIKPVFSDSSDSVGEDSSLDWLNELSGAGRQEGNKTPTADDEKQEAQDWLSQIRRSSDTSAIPAQDETPEASEDEDVPDWMQGLLDKDEPAPSTSSNNWMDRFRSPSESPEPSGDSYASSDEDEEEQSAYSSQSAGQDEEWLANLQSLQPEEESGWQEEEPLSPWLSGEDQDRQETSQSEAAFESEEQEYRSPSANADEDSDVPSWLQFLEEEMPADRVPQVPALQMPEENDFSGEDESRPLQQETGDVPQEEDDDLEIWLRSLDVDPQSLETGSSSAEPVEPLSESGDSEEEPMDFSTFRAGIGFEEGSESLPSEENEKPQDELPEWLGSGLKEETAEQESEELPDWLRSPVQEENTGSLRQEEDLPAWLGAAAEDEESPEPFELGEEDLPEWLGQSPDEEEKPPESETPPFSSAETQLPDWLQKSGEPEQIGQPLGTKPEPVTPFDLGESEISQWTGEEASEEPPSETIESEEFAYPDVFLNTTVLDETIDQGAGDTDGELGSSQEFPPFVGEDLGEWFKDLGQIDVSDADEEEGSLLQKAEAGGESAIFGDREFTSLLSDAGLDEEDLYPRTDGEDSEASGDLEEVDLPDWLRAMRPIEAIAGDSMDPLDERKVESAGPLAGLRSVLPAEEIILHYQKPPVYSMKLQVSDKQRAHAGILERILEPSKTKTSAAKKESGISVRILRLVVGLVLLAVILLPSFLPMIGPRAVSTGEAVQAFYSQIESLPQGETVLLAADFENAYYGEMRLAAENVILHLSAKKARLALVSTLPSGPILGEALVNDVLSDYPEFYQQYQQPDWINNLGYLAGGLASLQEFSTAPRQAIQFGMQAGLTNEYIWNSSSLNEINNISDFGLVVLITDRPETGRAWVEQVQPVMGNTPFLLLTSAQAAPLLNAYYQSDQFDGMLAGIQDGIAYPLRPQGSGTEFKSWDSFHYGMLAAVTLLIIGILINLVFSLFKRETREEAQP